MLNMSLIFFYTIYNLNRAHSTAKLIPRTAFYRKEVSGIWNDFYINTKKMHRNKVIEITLSIRLRNFII